MSDDPNQTAMCNAAIERSAQDALTIARLCKEITVLREQLDHERRERKAAQRTIARLGGEQ